MLHFEAIPNAVWYICLAIVAVCVFVNRHFRKQKTLYLERNKQQRIRNIAQYRAWNWLKGRPKQLKITDNRRSNGQ